MRWSPRLAGCLVAVAALAAPSAGLAHSELRSAEPPPGARLASVPASVRLVFSAPVEEAFLRLRVVADDGTVVSGPARRDPRDSRAIVAPGLRLSVQGPLRVEWRVLSQDGHPGGGAFVLGVGAEPSPVTDDDVVRRDLGPLPVAARLLALAGPLGALGLLALAIGVVGPAVRAGGISVPGEPPARSERFVAHARAALDRRGSGWWIAWWVMVGAQAVGLALAPAALLWGLREDAGELGRLLGDTRFGEGWWGQVVALLLLLVMSVVVRRRVAGRAPPLDPRLLVLGLGPLVALWSISDSGHASTGADATLNVAIDLVHSVATAAWFGGLLGLAVLVIPALAGLADDDRVRLAAAVVVRFSALALTAVAVLVVTGVYRALAEVSVGELATSAYGRALLVKLGLFAVLLVGGAYNRMIVHPRLERAALGLDPSDRGAAAALRMSVRAELVLAAALLVSVAVLVSLPPPG